MSFTHENAEATKQRKLARLMNMIPADILASGSISAASSNVVTGTGVYITAFAGGGQTYATQLTESYNSITTCATAKDSVKLPKAQAGEVVVVRNSGAASLDVFPAVGDGINALNINLAVPVPIGTQITFTAISNNYWETDSLGLTLTAPSTQKGSLTIRAAANSGETETKIINASQADARTYTIPDAGAATANFMLDQGTTAAKTITTLTSTTINATTLNVGSVQVTTPLLTTPVGTVTIAEYGNGRDIVDVLTLTNFIVGTLPSATAALGVGNIVCAFPGGNHLELVYYASLSLKCPSTGRLTDTALGSLIASGAIATLTGATMHDRLTAMAITTGSGGGTVVEKMTAATAGIGTGISLNITGSVKNVFLNSASADWSTDNAGNLTATGTIVLKWTKMGA